MLALVQELMDKNFYKDATIYMQITRGVAARMHGFPAGNITPALVITAAKPALPTAHEYTHGVDVVTMPDIRWKRRDIKTISLLPNILAKQQASEQNAAEAIFIEDDGYITEGSSANFFILDKNSVLRTHPANWRILNGITRLGIIKTAINAGIPVEEQAFRLADVMECKNAFISSTTKHILPVVKVNGSVIGGAVICDEIKELMKLYQEYINSQLV